MWAFDAETGEVELGRGLETRIGGPISVVDGTIYTGSVFHSSLERGKGETYAIDTDSGAIEWIADTAPVFRSTVYNGTVYAGTASGLQAIDAASGAERWFFREKASLRTPVVRDETVFVEAGIQDEKIGMFAIDAKTGNEEWLFPTEPAPDRKEPVPYRLGNLIVTDDTVFGHVKYANAPPELVAIERTGQDVNPDDERVIREGISTRGFTLANGWLHFREGERKDGNTTGGGNVQVIAIHKNRGGTVGIAQNRTCAREVKRDRCW